MQADLFEYFVSPGPNGVLEDCFITLIYKTDGTDLTWRENIGEGYWRLFHIMGWILLPKSSIFWPVFYKFLQSKVVINVTCLTQNV